MISSEDVKNKARWVGMIGIIQVPRYHVLGQLLSLSMTGREDPSLEASFDKLLALNSKPQWSYDSVKCLMLLPV